MSARFLFVFATVALLSQAHSSPAHASDPVTKVFINGTAAPVYFNDGVSFRVQEGKYKGQQARLSGYNTLESYGVAHQWGDWTAHELYVIAKVATFEARKGVWHCEGDDAKDTYGRLLLFCKDLAAHLIEKGLAHAYSVDDNRADLDLLETQKRAITARRGFWAHGVPKFIMTSLHSKSEGGDKKGKTSNRLISTADGHSEKWEHNDDYKECETVCHEVAFPTDGDLQPLLDWLKADAEAGGLAASLSIASLRAFLEAGKQGHDREGVVGVMDDSIVGMVPPPGMTAEDVGTLMSGLKRYTQGGGKLLVTGRKKDSCMIYVDFQRRFGGDRAACLK